MTAKTGDNMTEFEKMEAGLVYDCNDADILKVQLPFVEKHWDFNQLRPTDFEGKQAFMKEKLPELFRQMQLLDISMDDVVGVYNSLQDDKG